ncbi:DNA-binding transcriptional MerR regulator [Catenuloplanes nepalensis]|uniref:DNA-binding transcriptional MerR regulator n=1 Tax=Catenuloplanes nepalensis TaxID=587533 RepID=A0ABT9MN33_9ACTN|nr:MerR family transcriptional regulator [Catenuloplanes nepalensis]MDP9792799.1 DNA-binding transcriptional MerR regulator [Catenuloplanes nepalensis]
MWTMEELLERVREALAAEYPGAPNGRVRELPDRRAVRWYATTGLVDRATAMRGRTALYGPRHLLQIVAVKRRQADGHSLAAIQAELAGATDAELAALARVPADLLKTDAQPAARPRFWATPPAAPSDPPATGGVREVGGVALGGGAFLLLPVRPSGSDLEDLADAAQPLIDLLRARGLLTELSSTGLSSTGLFSTGRTRTDD